MKMCAQWNKTLYVGMVPKHPLSPNIMEFLNAAVINLFRFITWPTGCNGSAKTRETRVVYMPQDKRLWHTTIIPRVTPRCREVTQGIIIYIIICHNLLSCGIYIYIKGVKTFPLKC